MLGLKLNLSHSHHAPCHPTRAHKEYVETQSCITETDRQQFSDEDHYQQIRRAKSNKSQQKKTQNGMSNEMQTIQLQVSKKKKRIQQNLTPQQIYSTNVIEQSLNISTKEVPINIRQMIKQKQKLIEDKVYLGISDKGSDLLERIYQSIDTQTHLKDRIQQNLTNLMDSIQSNLEKDIIDSNKYFIHKIIRSTKEDVIKNTKRKAYDADSLNSKGITFQTSQSGNNKDESQSFASSSHPSQQDFSLKSQHTKKAEQFIKKIQKQQIQQRRKRKQQQERMKSLQVKSMEEKKQFEEQIKTQRKNYLKRRIQAKKQIKQKQLEVREKMNKQYYSFLKKYKKSKPLYKQKQQKYNKFLEEEKIKQLSVLDKIKQQKRSISISQILDHQQKYKNYKKQKSKSKLNELNLESKAQTPMKNYYRAKIFDVLQEEQQQQKQRQIKEHPNFIRSELIKKRDLYARHVREVYLPKGDEAKQNELRELIQKLEWAEKLKSGKFDPKQRNQAGNQYLRRIHELISQLRSKNKLPLISKSIDLDQIEMSTKPQYKNYLQELKLKRRSYSIDYEDLQEFNIQDAQIRAQKYERNAKRRQSYLRGNSFNIDRTLQERKRIDDQYLQSVKAKMAILNKYD